MTGTTKTARKHILFIGRKNVGKARLAQALIGEDPNVVSSISPHSGAPRPKSSRLFPYDLEIHINAVDLEELCDDFHNDLNQEGEIFNEADFIIVVLDGREHLTFAEIELFLCIKKMSIPFLVAVNKIEYGVDSILLSELKSLNAMHFEISCKENVGIDDLKLKMIRMMP